LVLASGGAAIAPAGAASAAALIVVAAIATAMPLRLRAGLCFKMSRVTRARTIAGVIRISFLL
jgi:hypothetical protein